MKKNTKKTKCYNCKHGSKKFKVTNITHLHCFHPKYKEEDFESGKLTAWDTLQKFSDSCSDHEFKQEKEVKNG